MTITSKHIAGLAFTLITFSRAAANETIDHPAQQPKVLNNFVTQLITANDLGGEATHSFKVENPRNGWLFFRTRALVGRSGSVRLSVFRTDAADAKKDVVITHEPGDGRTAEAMRFLKKGDYAIHLAMADADVALLDVRLIPMIIYERMWGTFRGMAGFPEYDRAFLQRHGMLDSINTIGTYDGFPWMRQWQDQGKRAIRISGGTPGLNTEEKAYQHWRGSMVHPTGDGMIIDEFYPGLKEHFPIWGKVLKRVREENTTGLCLIYTAGGAESLRDIIEPLAELDFYWVPEEQVEESRLTHEEVVEQGFARGFVTGFEKAGYFPNISERTVHSIGIFSGPSESKYNDDVYPDRNWKVLKELHFHELATHPLHKNNAGVDMYQSPQCQEEYLRWMARLCRHYCIEGNTTRLTNDRYELNHIQNPDFEQGFDGWTVEQAEPGSMGIRYLKGYGLKVQGRHGHAGDHLLWMKQSADKPNIIRQPIKHLEPGRYYCVTMYSGDYQNLHVRKVNQVALIVRGDIREQTNETMNQFWQHNADKDFGDKPTFPNYHRIVFQAKKDTAELVISDWHSASSPNGPVGQELVFNFVQVEPYLMPQ